MALGSGIKSFPIALHSAFLLPFLLLPFQASLVLSLLASAEPLLSSNPAQLRRSDFPKGVVFGASTSAYQVEGAVHEGGRGLSVWDLWTHTPGVVYDNSDADVSDDQYHRYEEDVDLISSLNMDAYRFSISWTRIFPDGYGSETNKEGIDYYNRLIDCLLRKGIKPYVTLFHWDTPQPFEDSFGGWLNREIVEHFARFAEACFAAFGDRVKNWLTMNEPGVYAIEGYSSGFFPPGRKVNVDKEVYIVAHNFLLAHAAAVDVYRKKFQAQQNGVIGFSVECQFAIPLTNSSEDIDAAQRSLEFQIGWFLDPIYFGDYPAVMRKNVESRLPRFSQDEIALLSGSLDFIGLNHYTSRYATTGPGPLPNTRSNKDLDRRVTMTALRDGVKIGEQGASTWLYVVPSGLYGLLKWTSERYKAPIYITENGIDFDGALSKEASIRDASRVQYFEAYLSAALAAIREGADVRAYFAWSLLDGYEWIGGYTKRFGLVYVDFKDGLKREPKDSALWFKDFLQRPQSESK